MTSACEKFLESGDVTSLLDDNVQHAMSRSQIRVDRTVSNSFPLMIDRQRAVLGAWYEMVPRSQGTVPGQHGTFRDCIARLPEIAALGFDVLYFTPISPDRARQP